MTALAQWTIIICASIAIAEGFILWARRWHEGSNGL